MTSITEGFRDIPLFRGPFLFLRHGQSTTNRAGIIAGWRNPGLTDLGREQAERAAQILKNQPITSIFSSPLRRARDTAAPVSRALGRPITEVVDLKERNWGVLEGCPLADRPHMHVVPDGGESWEGFQNRILGALGDLPPVPGLPLLVAHSGVMRVLRVHLGVTGGDERAANGLPIRLDPPAEGQTSWRETPLDHM